MKHFLKIPYTAFTAGLLVVVLTVSSVQADVTRKHKISSSFMGASETLSTEYYASDRSTSETLTKWTEGMMKTMTGGKSNESISVVRLDKEVIWNIQPKKQTYNEMTFAEFREMIQKGIKQMQEMRGPDTSASSENDYAWTTEDKSDPNPKTINGYSCKNAKVTAIGINKKNPEDKVWITMDIWNSKDLPGADDILAYQQRYMKAINLDESVLTPGLMTAMGSYQKQMGQLFEAVKKAPGEPVLMTIEVKNRQIAIPKAEGDTLNIGNAAAQEMLSKLPFGFKKEKKEKKEPPAPKEPQSGELQYEDKVSFQMTNELIEASTGAIDASKFEVPSGYKLVKTKERE
ncbi:MAG: hypothetical protein NTW14_10090 [bacterium]|nr:hypothetical protein [bacterium]